MRDDHPVLRHQRTPLIGVGDTQLVGPNPTRIGLIISAPANHALWLSFTGPAAPGSGIRLGPNTPSLVILWPALYSALTEEVRACMETAGEPIGVVEFFF